MTPAEAMTHDSEHGSVVGKMTAMEGRSRRTWAYVAAGTLAFVTLGTFSLLQSSGPESTLRSFHAALERRDVRELQRVTKQDLRTQNAQILMRQVNTYLRSGANYQLVRMERQPRLVRAAVVYTLPAGDQIGMIWVVEKPNSVWQIDADRTATILRDSLGF